MKAVKESGKVNLIYTVTGSYNYQLDLIVVSARAHASSIPTITLFSSPLAVCIQSCNLQSCGFLVLLIIIFTNLT